MNVAVNFCAWSAMRCTARIRSCAIFGYPVARQELVQIDDAIAIGVEFKEIVIDVPYHLRVRLRRSRLFVERSVS